MACNRYFFVIDSRKGNDDALACCYGVLLAIPWYLVYRIGCKSLVHYIWRIGLFIIGLERRLHQKQTISIENSRSRVVNLEITII